MIGLQPLHIFTALVVVLPIPDHAVASDFPNCIQHRIVHRKMQSHHAVAAQMSTEMLHIVAGTCVEAVVPSQAVACRGAPLACHRPVYRKMQAHDTIAAVGGTTNHDVGWQVVHVGAISIKITVPSDAVANSECLHTRSRFAVADDDHYVIGFTGTTVVCAHHIIAGGHQGRQGYGCSGILGGPKIAVGTVRGQRRAFKLQDSGVTRNGHDRRIVDGQMQCHNTVTTLCRLVMMHIVTRCRIDAVLPSIAVASSRHKLRVQGAMDCQVQGQHTVAAMFCMIVTIVVSRLRIHRVMPHKAVAHHRRRV